MNPLSLYYLLQEREATRPDGKGIWVLTPYYKLSPDDEYVEYLPAFEGVGQVLRKYGELGEGENHLVWRKI